MMTYVSPVIEDKFNTLDKELRDFILDRNVDLYTMEDLINVLEQIVNESDKQVSNWLKAFCYFLLVLVKRRFIIGTTRKRLFGCIKKIFIITKLNLW